MKIRFLLPVESPFKLAKDGTITILPGLEFKQQIKFTLHEPKVYRDEVRLDYMDQTMMIPLIAYPPAPRFSFDQEIIDLGSVGINTARDFTFNLTNIGVKSGNFKLISNEPTVKLSIKSTEIGPAETMEISGTFSSSVPGEYNFEIALVCGETLEPVIPVKVKVKALATNLYLLYKNNPLEELDFGTIYYGQKKVKKAVLKNDCPYKRSFMVIPPRGTNSAEDGIFTAKPSEGFLEPNSSVVIDFIYAPFAEESSEGDLESIFTHTSAIELVETSQRISFKLSGKAVRHLVSLNYVDFGFNEQEVGSKTTQVLELKNESQFLNTSFEIRDIPHYKFQPLKGSLKKNETAQIEVSFCPKAYGIFDTIGLINFCNGLEKKHFNLTGTCVSKVDPKPFIREPLYERESSARFALMHPERKYQFSLEEVEAMNKRKVEYDAWIGESARIRQKRIAQKELLEKTKKLMQSTGIDYSKKELLEMARTRTVEEMESGVGHCEGLIPPDPPLLTGKMENAERKHMKSNEGDGLNQQKRKQQFDDNVLIRKKFKAKPTTPNEISDCSHAITPAQQFMISASHQHLNFGEVSVFSKVTKCFAVTNGLQQPILVAVDYKYDELSQSGPASQVVPGKQTAGFDISFSSKKPCHFNKTIEYTINGQHTHTLTITATVVPIEVQLSRNVIEFKFAQDTIAPFVKEYVTLYNRSNTNAKFTWTGANQQFNLSTVSGIVEARKSTIVEITYIPATQSRDEVDMTLAVEGGPARSLKCIGLPGCSKCQLLRKKVDFGLIPIGISKTQQLKIKNSGPDDAIFTLTYQCMPEIVITPTSGRITAGDHQTFDITFNSTHAQVFEVSVNVEIAGAQPITFVICGQAELPKVQLSNSEFDFGRTYVGSTVALDGTLTNTGVIPAILFLDLYAKPEFRFEYPQELTDRNECEHCNSVSLVADPCFITTGAPVQSAVVNKKSSPPANNTSTNNGLIYKITLIEGSSIKFKLVYQPTEVNDHSFELPFTLMNVVTASAFHLQPVVSAEAVRAPLSLSVNMIDFGISPLFNASNPHYRASVRTIVIKSDQKGETQWHLECNNSAFSVEPSSGVIKYNECKTIHITFLPTVATPYHEYMPLYADTNGEHNLISNVQMTGVGTVRNIDFDVSDVCLPVVPVGQKSEMTVNLINNAFVEGYLHAELPFDEKVFPVKISFPEGNFLQHMTQRMPIKISFMSPKPMSFSTVVAIVDDHGNAASMNVTCTTDNSVFTLYQLLKSPNGRLEAQTGKPIIYEGDEIPAKKDLLSQFISVKDFVNLPISDFEPSVSKEEINFLLRYLNTLVMSTPINDFPGDLVRSDGSLLNEMITNLNGSRKQGFDSFERSQEAHDQDPIVKKREALRKILGMIQSAGGLLGPVRPEFLLSRADFLYFMRMKVSKQLLGVDYFNAPDLATFDQKVLGEFTSSKLYSNALISRMKVLETVYDELSVEAWTMVIMQIFRVFIFTRVDGEKLGRLPGVADVMKALKDYEPAEMLQDVCRPVKLLSQSNAFSLQECALLKWASMCNAHLAGSLVPPINDFADLRTGVAIGALVSHHAERKIDIDATASEKLIWEKNSVAIIAVLKEMKISFCPTSDEIVSGSRIVLAIILEYLYEILPHYLPKTMLEFNTQLHQMVTRSFTVNNASKAEITYHARINDTVNFRLPVDSVVVGPNGSAEFQVEFLARTVNPLAARLELIPSRPRMIGVEDYTPKERQNTTNGSAAPSARGAPRVPVFSAPIVVDLRTNVAFQAPDQTFNLDGVIYQTSTLQIPIKNFLATPSNLEIRKHICRMIDENGNSIHQAPLPELLKKMVNNMNVEELESQPLATDSQFDALIKEHKTFLLSTTSVEFVTDREDETVNIEVEFVPIGLGTYRCILLFVDEKAGEFVLEIVAKANVPSPVEIMHGKLRAESGQKSSSSTIVDLGNQNLVKALAYSTEKYSMIVSYQNERKFRDLLNRRIHEIEAIYKQNVTSEKFTVVNSSPQYFEMPSSLVVSKTAGPESRNTANTMNVVFRPSKAGEYPCKILLLSRFDVRLFSITALGIVATKEISLEFSTAAGRVVKQEIPLHNPSQDVWNYKVSFNGDQAFDIPQRVSVKPQSVGTLNINFLPFKVGNYSGEVTVFNQNKESTVIYKLSGTVDEPPAEQKIVLNCQARQKLRHKIEIKPFIKSGVLTVTTTVPIITFQKELMVSQGEVVRNFEFSVFAQRSGLAAGTITFTDQTTNTYIWYVLEIHVDPPAPEETIAISTTARKSATVSIPIANPKSVPAAFSVVLSDDDMFGETEFTVPPKTCYDYALVVSPLKAMKRMSSIYFYSEDDGEFWYSLRIEASDPPDNTLAMLTSAIGKFASTFILLENPYPKPTVYRIENDNVLAFQVMGKRVIQLAANEKKRIEVRYIPTCVGSKEVATISFRSTENGDWVYKLSGTGKPPQPLSPVIVTSTVDSANSALVIFTNPFPYPSRFAVSMNCEDYDTFNFLVKRKIFTLNSYGEEFQIPFSFTPRSLGQFKGYIVVASVGPARGPLPDLEAMPSVRWVYPIIGNSVAGSISEVRMIHCRAQTQIEDDLELTLVGETEIFEVSEYQISLSLPSQYEFLRQAIHTHTVGVQRVSNATSIVIHVRFTPQRPLQCQSTLKVTNPMGQEWQFQVEFCAEKGKPVDTIIIESLLNKEGIKRVTAPVAFRQATPFTAHFAPGSAGEFRVTPDHGVIPASLDDNGELPFNVVFAPKMYGKVLKGVLVVDTTEAQYLYEVVGKTPEYVPPVFERGSGIVQSQVQELQTKKRRNIIKDNIEKVKTMNTQKL